MITAMPKITRQQFIHTGLAIAAMPLSLSGCTPAESHGSYEEAIKQTWRISKDQFENEQLLQRELVRCATLAPSGHNTQPWKFHIERGSISMLPDFNRRTSIVDPDDHHLFVSLGCALENMVQASKAYGLQSVAQFDAAKDVVTVRLEPTKALASPLFHAIANRQCTRGIYDGLPLAPFELKELARAGSGNGVSVLLFDAKADIKNILQLIIDGNTAQLNDAAFTKELKQWIRFSGGEAVEKSDGLYARSSGNPSVPRWLGGPMFDIFFNAKSENDKYAKQVSSSAGIAIFISEVDDKTHWLEAGRCYERFALQATAFGIRNAMLNQVVEDPLQRQKLAAWLGVKGGRPDLVVRFGRGPTLPQSLRRNLEAVLI